MSQPRNVTVTQLTPPWEKHTCSESLDRLIEESLQQLERSSPTPARYKGQMKFDNLALMGPPGRLQGGLHCVGRLFPILRKISEHPDEQTFPCAFYTRLGRAIPLFEEIDFTATYHSTTEQEWRLTTRFQGTDRLNAALWSIKNRDLLSPDAWRPWQERFEAACNSDKREDLVLFGTSYQRTEDLMWCSFGPNPDDTELKSLQRFAVSDSDYGLAFVCYHLDILGALAQRKTMEWTPHFTTHVSLALAGDRVPRDRKLIAIADRSGMRPDPLSALRPVSINGQERGTTTTGVLLTDETFSTVYAYGWVSVHPISSERMSSLVEKFQKSQAAQKRS